jgi:hypothetical protein
MARGVYVYLENEEAREYAGVDNVNFSDNFVSIGIQGDKEVDYVAHFRNDTIISIEDY